MKMMICLLIALFAIDADASFFKWLSRGYVMSPENSAKIIDNKNIQHFNEVPNDGTAYTGAGWKCEVDSESMMENSTIGDSFVEKRGMTCKHSTGVEESQIAVCIYDKKTKESSTETKDVNLKFQNSKLHVELMCINYVKGR